VGERSATHHAPQCSLHPTQRPAPSPFSSPSWERSGTTERRHHGIRFPNLKRAGALCPPVPSPPPRSVSRMALRKRRERLHPQLGSLRSRAPGGRKERLKRLPRLPHVKTINRPTSMQQDGPPPEPMASLSYSAAPRQDAPCHHIATVYFGLTPKMSWWRRTCARWTVVPRRRRRLVGLGRHTSEDASRHRYMLVDKSMLESLQTRL